MINEQLRSVPPPLKTGEFIPKERSAFWLDQLVTLAEEGKVLRTPRTFDDIQARLTSEAGTILPEELVQRFGFAGLDFVELVHPDSKPIVFAGYKKDGKDIVGKPLNETVAIIDLDRSNGMVWGGWAGIFSNRLLPSGITISGVDRETKRVLIVRYDAFYHFLESPADDPPSRSVAFSIGKIDLSVPDEDGFEFKSGLCILQTVPYQYLSEYADGVVTEAMLAETSTDVSPKHKNSVYVQRYSRAHGLDAEVIYYPLPQGIQNSPNDFYHTTVGDKVKVGRKNAWEIQIPRKLPQTIQTFDFLNIAS